MTPSWVVLVAAVLPLVLHLASFGWYRYDADDEGFARAKGYTPILFGLTVASIALAAVLADLA